VKVITLRKLPHEVARVVQRRAKEHGTSISKAVVGLLEEAVGSRRPAGAARLYHDLDSLAGSWTAEEAEAFDQALREQRPIDPELWQ
jgi:plasmid stability protein